MRNFRIVLTGIDVAPLLRQLADHPELWNTDSVRTSKFATVHYAVDDIILRYPGRGENWNCAAFNVLTEAQPIIFRLAAAVRAELIGRVVISRLSPGKQIPTHTDIHVSPGFYQRYQIPLAARPGVDFICGDEKLFMEPGNVYWFANTINHAVVNNSDSPRLSMLADIRPFSPA